VVSCAALTPAELEHICGITPQQSLYLVCLFSEAPAAELPLLQLFEPPSAAPPAHRLVQCAVSNRDALEFVLLEARSSDEWDPVMPHLASIARTVSSNARAMTAARLRLNRRSRLKPARLQMRA
jgi:hypothetical protein